MTFTVSFEFRDGKFLFVEDLQDVSINRAIKCEVHQQLNFIANVTAIMFHPNQNKQTKLKQLIKQ